VEGTFLFFLAKTLYNRDEVVKHNELNNRITINYKKLP